MEAWRILVVWIPRNLPGEIGKLTWTTMTCVWYWTRLDGMHMYHINRLGCWRDWKFFFSKMAGKGWVKTLILEALEGGRRNCARQISHLLRGHTFPTIGFLEAVPQTWSKWRNFGCNFFPKIAHPYTHLDTTEQKKWWFREDLFPGFLRPNFSSEKRGYFEASASPHPC